MSIRKFLWVWVLGLSALGGCASSFDASRVPHSPLNSEVGMRALKTLGFRVYPVTQVFVVNNLSRPVLVEGSSLPLQLLDPGARAQVVFEGYPYPKRAELVYFAYGVDRGGRTGEVATKKFRLARRGVEVEVWNISRLRRPR